MNIELICAEDLFTSLVRETVSWSIFPEYLRETDLYSQPGKDNKNKFVKMDSKLINALLDNKAITLGIILLPEKSHLHLHQTKIICLIFLE